MYRAGPLYLTVHCTMYIMCKAGQVANASKPAGYTLTFPLLPQEFKTRKSQTEALLYITET